MRVIEIKDQFGLDHLAVAERPEPEPGPGQVAIEMAAASLNYRDLLTVRGHYNPKQPLPLIPCSDGAGKVLSVGEGVSMVKPGDRVATIFAQDWLAGRPDARALGSTLGGPLDGTLCERMVLPQWGVVPVPEHLTDAEASTLPCAALTAWNALTLGTPIQAGDTVLVLGTGGVSIFALQLAQILGVRVIVTSSSDEKLERARELGAWQTINYLKDPDWGKTVRKLSNGGVDLIVEVGGAGTLAQSMLAIRPGGQISLIGVLAGGKADLDVIPILMRCIRVQGILVGHRRSLMAMNRAIAMHGLRPVVDRVFPLAESRAALEHMADGRHFGKVCIEINAG
jgi:NADPH:quinone reductase-like Zn-dependent oxidoreductase